MFDFSTIYELLLCVEPENFEDGAAWVRYKDDYVDIDHVQIKDTSPDFLNEICASQFDIGKTVPNVKIPTGYLLIAHAPYYVFIRLEHKVQFVALVEIYFGHGLPHSSNPKFAFAGPPKRMATGVLVRILHDLVEADEAINVLSLSYGMKAVPSSMIWLDDLMAKYPGADVVLDVAFEESPSCQPDPIIPLVCVFWKRFAHHLPMFGQRTVRVFPLFDNYQCSRPRKWRFGGLNVAVPQRDQAGNELWEVKVYPKLAHIWKNVSQSRTNHMPKNFATFRNSLELMDRIISAYKDNPATVEMLRYEFRINMQQLDEGWDKTVDNSIMAALFYLKKVRVREVSLYSYCWS